MHAYESSVLFLYRDMYGVRGRRHLAQSETGGRRRGSEPAAGSRRDGAGAEDGPQPVDVEKLLDLRVTDVIDPASFWAQVGEGRRAFNSAYTQFLILVSVIFIFGLVVF